jgi:hypothetical protein
MIMTILTIALNVNGSGMDGLGSTGALRLFGQRCKTRFAMPYAA